MLQTPDRFVFENRGLADWLLQLVDENSTKRRAAAKVVSDRFFMPTELIPGTKRGVEQFFEEFRAAVRQTLAQPNFPASNFVRNILAMNFALQESWFARVAEDSARDAEADKVALAKLGEHPTEAAQKRYVRRVWIQMLRECKKIREEEPHEVFVTGAASHWVIDALGEELLPAADILREMLSNRHKASLASDAIARMGRKGLEFYGDLLAGLEREDLNHYSAKALGGVLKAAPEKIPEILQLAFETKGRSQLGAIHALDACGRAATEAVPEVETRLREMFETSTDETLWFAALAALGACGQTTQTVTSLLARLDPAQPHRAGEIILALGAMARDPERVVPRLADLLNTFEEYDPDWSYHGDHERVVQALSAFSSAAASAVPALIRHIWTRPEKYWTREKTLADRPEPDEAVIKLLGHLGVAASDALPRLLEVQKELKRRAAEDTATGSAGTCADTDSSSNSSDSAADPLIDSYVDIAIKQISSLTYDP